MSQVSPVYNDQDDSGPLPGVQGQADGQAHESGKLFAVCVCVCVFWLTSCLGKRWLNDRLNECAGGCCVVDTENNGVGQGHLSDVKELASEVDRLSIEESDDLWNDEDGGWWWCFGFFFSF